MKILTTTDSWVHEGDPDGFRIRLRDDDGNLFGFRLSAAEILQIQMAFLLTHPDERAALLHNALKVFSMTNKWEDAARDMGEALGPDFVLELVAELIAGAARKIPENRSIRSPRGA